jgi:hypothetical protein
VSRKALLTSSILIALALVWLTASYAFGCIPDDQNTNQCIRLPRVTQVALVSSDITLRPTPASHAVFAPAAGKPGAANPDVAGEPTGNWEWIAPYATVWYKVSDTRMALDVWVDANRQGGLALAVFAPEQTEWWNSTPVGRGSFNASQPEHDLFWTGHTRAYGSWNIRLTNHNDFPVSYSLNYFRKAISQANYCASCHGYDIDEWDRCENRGNDNFCGNLEGNYK